MSTNLTMRLSPHSRRAEADSVEIEIEEDPFAQRAERNKSIFMKIADVLFSMDIFTAGAFFLIGTLMIITGASFFSINVKANCLDFTTACGFFFLILGILFLVPGVLFVKKATVVYYLFLGDEELMEEHYYY
ncbi:hypothetical protein CDAR_171701 [Caerostris darwini]|uniref:Transmembrane protein 230 n=1 Tax=Caerostris darwini TaxID=1538125 RepID=A0AAV4V1K1_9ARAC|nr:hypothetical protein CDAR_171701 [Caerostris darwini]